MGDGNSSKDKDKDSKGKTSDDCKPKDYCKMLSHL